MKRFRSYLAVYKITKAGKTWKADFNNYEEAQAYINSKRDKKYYFIYEGFLAREEVITFNLDSGLQLEGIYKAEAVKAIS